MKILQRQLWTTEPSDRLLADGYPLGGLGEAVAWGEAGVGDSGACTEAVK